MDLEDPVVEALSMIGTVAENVATVNTNVDSILSAVNNETYGLAAIKNALSSAGSGLSLKSVSKTYTSIASYSSSNRNGGTASGLTAAQLAGLVSMRVTAGTGGSSGASFSGEIGHVSGSKISVTSYTNGGNLCTISLGLDNSEYGVQGGNLYSKDTPTSVKITFYYLA